MTDNVKETVLLSVKPLLVKNKFGFWITDAKFYGPLRIKDRISNVTFRL